MSHDSYEYLELSESASKLEESFYLRVSQSPFKCPRWGLQSRVRPIFLWIAGSILLFSSLITVGVVWPHKNISQLPSLGLSKYLHHCGISTAEAISLGCEFDLLGYSWTPAPCLDRETSKDFKEWLLSEDRVRSPWPFYADFEGTEWIPDETSLSMKTDGSIWTTQEEHLGHCTFMMQRLHKVAVKGVNGTLRYTNWMHTKHCSLEILKGLGDPSFRDQNWLGSKFAVAFDYC
jgi:hypothetical protein